MKKTMTTTLGNMKNNMTLLVYSMVIFCGILFSCNTSIQKKENKAVAAKASNDWFLNQRMFPYAKLDYEGYRKSVNTQLKQLSTTKQNGASVWQLAGSINTGGRLTDVEMHASSTTTMYLGAASGGVFKSVDAGNTWAPIFDGNASLSIGDIAIAPSDPNIIYVGTGEANAGGGSLTYDGAGIYKSTDAGATWTSVGLELTRNTGRIVIDPQNPDRVFAATMGDLFGDTPDRGVYRTLDGGATWTNVLNTDDSTGAIEVVMHPVNTDTLFACMWTRVRRPVRRNYGGPSSGIYRSYDGGTTWNKLTNPFSSLGLLGRIGISISQSNPSVLYAEVMNDFGAAIGVYKSTNNGDTWTNVTTNLGFAGNSYWYGRIKVDPTNQNTVYVIDFDTWKTTDGGNSWNNLTSGVTHVDQHEVYIHPSNPNLVLLGNDGGFYKSTNGGNQWIHNETLPVMQFYTCEVDESQPNQYYGGTQDNGVITTLTGNTNDWFSIWGGDGFVVLVDPNNPGSWIAESQYAGISTGLTGVDPNHKFNWNTPFIFNPHNSQSMYIGANHLYKSHDQGFNWFEISPDLTKGIGPSQYPIVYATITTVDVAASDTNVIYVGTDDGNVQMTTDEGQSWTDVSAGLPLRWVTRVAADPRNAMDVYVSLSGYRYHDNMSHVYHSDNGGQTWIDIGGNLPDVPVNDLIVDTLTNTIYVGTDIGVYFSHIATVTNWSLLGAGLPLAPVTDLRLHYPTHKLVAATYGRSMYSLDLNTMSGLQTNYNLPKSLVVNVNPNPVHEQLTVSIYAPANILSAIKVYDINGSMIYNNESVVLNEGKNTLRLNAVAAVMKRGVYYLQVNTKGMKPQTIKVLKQ